MVELTTGQPLATMPDYKVFEGGTFAPTELVQVFTDDSALPIGQFPAQFISTGEFA